MSIKSRLKRQLNSPQNIKTPFKFKKDLEVDQFFNKILGNMYEMYSLFTKSYVFTEVNTDITTNGFIDILALDTLTVTLNDNPADNEEVNIKLMTASTITIDGNGKDIDGLASFTMSTQYEKKKIIYIKSQDKWGLF